MKATNRRSRGEYRMKVIEALDLKKESAHYHMPKAQRVGIYEALKGMIQDAWRADRQHPHCGPVQGARKRAGRSGA